MMVNDRVLNGIGGAFLPPHEQLLYDSTVHGLRSQGWSRIEAEGEAIARIDERRRKVKSA